MKYAIVKEGVVVNVIVYDGECDYESDNDTLCVPCANYVGIGWTYANEQFLSPIIEETET